MTSDIASIGENDQLCWILCTGPFLNDIYNHSGIDTAKSGVVANPNVWRPTSTIKGRWFPCLVYSFLLSSSISSPNKKINSNQHAYSVVPPHDPCGSCCRTRLLWRPPWLWLPWQLLRRKYSSITSRRGLRKLTMKLGLCWLLPRRGHAQTQLIFASFISADQHYGLHYVWLML